MSDISKLTKDEMINYLYVRDLVRGEDDNKIITENKLNYTDMMMYALPFILVLILILVIYLVYKQYKTDANKKST